MASREQIFQAVRQDFVRYTSVTKVGCEITNMTIQADYEDWGIWVRVLWRYESALLAPSDWFWMCFVEETQVQVTGPFSERRKQNGNR
jgi:hypothetical protein